MQWLRNWFKRRKVDDREIFSYFDGQRTRYADPVRLHRAMLNHEKCNFNNDGPLFDRGQEPEATRFLDALCEIFGAKRWDEETMRGLTDKELVDLINQLMDFIEGLKKNISPTPTSSAPTESESSTSPESPDGLMNSGSDSGPASSGSKPVSAPA